MTQPRVSVVIPTLNEARNLPAVFAELPPWLHEVIIVDGRSVDDTVAVARQLRPDVRVITQCRTGKGNALACGFAAATGDVIVAMDADGSTDPAEIPRFVEALTEGADFVKGSRFMAGGRSTDITRLRKAGNRFLNGLVNVTFKTNYTDLCYGYNALWARHLDVLALDHGPLPDGERGPRWGDGFEIETLMNVRVALAGLHVAEVPSEERSRLHGASNLNAFTDGMRVLRIIGREWRRQRGLTTTRRRSRRHPGGTQVPVPAQRTAVAPDHVIDLVRADLDEALNFDDQSA